MRSAVIYRLCSENFPGIIEGARNCPLARVGPGLYPRASKMLERLAMQPFPVKKIMRGDSQISTMRGGLGIRNKIDRDRYWYRVRRPRADGAVAILASGTSFSPVSVFIFVIYTDILSADAFFPVRGTRTLATILGHLLLPGSVGACYDYFSECLFPMLDRSFQSMCNPASDNWKCQPGSNSFSFLSPGPGTS